MPISAKVPHDDFRARSMRILALACAALFVLLRLGSGEAGATSFNCAKTQIEAERLICKDTFLSDLDDKVHAAFKKAAANSSPELVAAAQARWIQQRNGCGHNQCISRVDEQWLDQLGSGLAIPDSDQNNPLDGSSFKGLAPAAQQQIRGEGQQFYSDCTNKSIYAQFHNCECLSKHFMSKRIHHPSAETNDLQQSIELDCVDEASIVNYARKNCLDMYSISYSQEVLGPLCECYAQNFAKGYAAYPNVSDQYETQLGAATMGQCLHKVPSK